MTNNDFIEVLKQIVETANDTAANWEARLYQIKRYAAAGFARAEEERYTNLYCDDMGLEFNEREKTAIASLSKRLEVRPKQVIKMALRAYQLQILGVPDVGEKAAPKPAE